MISDLIQYEFLRNTFASGMLIGIIAPLLGVFIVVRRMSLIADALSHVTLSGIAISMFLSSKFHAFENVDPVHMGTLFSITGAILIERMRTVYKHYQELAIPIIMSAGIGLGVIFISLGEGFSTEITNYLFGSVSAVSDEDVRSIFIITVVVIASISLMYKELFAISFDEEYAKVAGLSVRLVHYAFIILVALTISASMRIVGILLVSSLMTLPVAAAMKVAKSFFQTIVYAVIFGEIAVIFGLIVSYHLDLVPGGTIVMSAVAILIAVILFCKIKAKFRVRSV